MAGLLHTVLDELMIETQIVIKPELTQTENIIFHWSAFPNLKVSLNLVQRVVSMGIWHAKVPLSRIQNPSQLQGGCPRAVPDLCPLSADGRGKRFSMRDGVEHKKKESGGGISESSEYQTLKTESGKTSRIALEPAGFVVLRVADGMHIFVGSGVKGGCSALIAAKSHHKKWTKTTRIHLILPTTTPMFASRHISIFIT